MQLEWVNDGREFEPQRKLRDMRDALKSEAELLEDERTTARATGLMDLKIRLVTSVLQRTDPRVTEDTVLDRVRDMAALDRVYFAVVFGVDGGAATAPLGQVATQTPPTTPTTPIPPEASETGSGASSAPSSP